MKRIKITFNYNRPQAFIEVDKKNTAQENHAIIEKKYGIYDVIKHDDGLLYENISNNE